MIKIDDRSKKQGLKKGENIMRVKRLVSLALAGMLAASVALKGCKGNELFPGGNG